MGTSDADFLNDIESRADEYVEYFTEQETYRLWRLCGYHSTPHEQRKRYMAGWVRAHVDIARNRITKQVFERLTR